MRPLNSGESGSVIRVWKSPVPYLFGGLGIMLALISAALVVLICSYRKRAYHQSSASAQEQDPNTKPTNSDTTDSEPKVVVIMAGDNNPTYLANPTASSTFCTCQLHLTPSLSSLSTKEGPNIN